MSADSSGMLYLSPGIQEVIGVKDGKKALQTTVTGDLNMHPSGEWGISFWVNSDTQKISNQGGNLTAEPWILTGLNAVSYTHLDVYKRQVYYWDLRLFICRNTDVWNF